MCTKYFVILTYYRNGTCDCYNIGYIKMLFKLLILAYKTCNLLIA